MIDRCVPCGRPPRDSRLFAGVYLIAVTLPGSMLAAWLSELFPDQLATVVVLIGIVISWLVNTAVISTTVELIKSAFRRRRRHHPLTGT
jgi:hypothetical protein